MRWPERSASALQELAREPFVDYASTHVPGLHAMVMLVFQQAGLTPHVAQEATQVQTVISLVQSGMGVALVPSVSARLAARDVVFRPVRGFRLQRAFHWRWQRELTLITLRRFGFVNWRCIRGFTSRSASAGGGGR